MRRVLRIGRATVAVVAVLLVAALVAARTALPSLLREVISSRASEALRTRVEIGGVELSLLGGRVGLHDVVVFPPGAGMADEPILGWKLLAAELDYEALRRKQIRLREIVLDTPRVALDRLADGQLNLQSLATPATAPTAAPGAAPGGAIPAPTPAEAPGAAAAPPAGGLPQGWSFALDRFVLRAGGLRFRDLFVPRSEPIEIEIPAIEVGDVRFEAGRFDRPARLRVDVRSEGGQGVELRDRRRRAVDPDQSDLHRRPLRQRQPDDAPPARARGSAGGCALPAAVRHPALDRARAAHRPRRGHPPRRAGADRAGRSAGRCRRRRRKRAQGRLHRRRALPAQDARRRRRRARERRRGAGRAAAGRDGRRTRGALAGGSRAPRPRRLAARRPTGARRRPRGPRQRRRRPLPRGAEGAREAGEERDRFRGDHRSAVARRAQARARGAERAGGRQARRALRRRPEAARRAARGRRPADARGSPRARRAPRRAGDRLAAIRAWHRRRAPPPRDRGDDRADRPVPGVRVTLALPSA